MGKNISGPSRDQSKIWTRGEGVKKLKYFADVIYVWSLSLLGAPGMNSVNYDASSSLSIAEGGEGEMNSPTATVTVPGAARPNSHSPAAVSAASGGSVSLRPASQGCNSIDI